MTGSKHSLLSCAEPTVYLIDHNHAKRTCVVTLLNRVGIIVRQFEAAEHFLEHTLLHPCCLITEVHLPGISGLDLIDHLHELGAKVPAILIAEVGDIETAVRGLRAGALDYIEHPIPERRLVERVRQAMALAVA